MKQQERLSKMVQISVSCQLNVCTGPSTIWPDTSWLLSFCFRPRKVSWIIPPSQSLFCDAISGQGWGEVEEFTKKKKKDRIILIFVSQDIGSHLHFPYDINYKNSQVLSLSPLMQTLRWALSSHSADTGVMEVAEETSPGCTTGASPEYLAFSSLFMAFLRLLVLTQRICH